MIKTSLIKIINDDKAFRFSDGKIAHSISELSHILENQSDSIFESHTGTNRNDFANWIEYVFEEKKLADNLRLCKTKKETINMIDIALHGEMSKTQEKKENHNKEFQSAQEKEQKELKIRLEELKKKLQNKIETENIEKTSDNYDFSKSLEMDLDALKYKPRKNILKDYIIVWLVTSFILGIVLGIVLSRIVL